MERLSGIVVVVGVALAAAAGAACPEQDAVLRVGARHYCADELAPDPDRAAAGRIWEAVRADVVARESIVVTAEDVHAFHEAHETLAARGRQEQEAQRRRLEAELAAPDLDPAERARAEQQLATLDKIAASDRGLERDLAQLEAEERARFDEGQRKMAEHFVLGWKIDRALYARHGGVVIFQQANPFEPVGAYRAELEAQEQAGTFAIRDPALRQQFWHYYTDMGHNEIPADAGDFAVPWWLRAVDQPTPE
jgi:hypothetical protein